MPIQPKMEFVCGAMIYRIQSKCSEKLLIPTRSEMDKNKKDYVCKGAKKNNNMMKKYIYLLPRAVKLQNIMRSEGK